MKIRKTRDIDTAFGDVSPVQRTLPFGTKLSHLFVSLVSACLPTTRGHSEMVSARRVSNLASTSPPNSMCMFHYFLSFFGVDLPVSITNGIDHYRACPASVFCCAPLALCVFPSCFSCVSVCLYVFVCVCVLHAVVDVVLWARESVPVVREFRHWQVRKTRWEDGKMENRV